LYFCPGNLQAEIKVPEKKEEKKEVLPQAKLITSPGYLVAKSSGNKSQGWLFY